MVFLGAKNTVDSFPGEELIKPGKTTNWNPNIDLETFFWSPPHITICDYRRTNLKELADSTAPLKLCPSSFVWTIF